MIRIPLLFVLLFTACSIFAREATITFSAPLTYCDKSLIKEGAIQHYDIIYSEQTMGLDTPEGCAETGTPDQIIPEGVTHIIVPGDLLSQDVDLEPGKSYYFTMRVCGHDPRGCSTFSNEFRMDVPDSRFVKPTLTFKLN